MINIINVCVLTSWFVTFASATLLEIKQCKWFKVLLVTLPILFFFPLLPPWLPLAWSKCCGRLYFYKNGHNNILHHTDDSQSGCLNPAVYVEFNRGKLWDCSLMAFTNVMLVQLWAKSSTGGNFSYWLLKARHHVKSMTSLRLSYCGKPKSQSKAPESEPTCVKRDQGRPGKNFLVAPTL